MCVILITIKMSFIEYNNLEIAFSIHWFLGSIYSSYLANDFIKNYEECEKYVDVIINNKQFNIDDIAEKIGDTPHEVVKQVTYMIKKGFLPYGYIDREKRKVIFKEMKICPNCGASQEIEVGLGQKCDFCETILY